MATGMAGQVSAWESSVLIIKVEVSSFRAERSCSDLVSRDLVAVSTSDSIKARGGQAEMDVMAPGWAQEHISRIMMHMMGCGGCGCWRSSKR